MVAPFKITKKLKHNTSQIENIKKLMTNVQECMTHLHYNKIKNAIAQQHHIHINLTIENTTVKNITTLLLHHSTK
jgi:hypothetical protein